MLFKPNCKIHRVTDITVEMLAERNICGLILDVDNTLSTHHGMQLVDGLEEWILKMQRSGIKLIILSNSNNERVKPFAEKIGLDYISMGLKPLPFGYIKSARQMGLKKHNVAIVGDQLFTDSLGGHISGVYTFITDPILPEQMMRFKIKRKLENCLYRIYKF